MKARTSHKWVCVALLIAGGWAAPAAGVVVSFSNPDGAVYLGCRRGWGRLC